MVEIIRPKFERKLTHKLRMLRAKPELKNHPEFEGVKDDSGSFLSLLALVAATLFMILRRT